MAYRTLLASFSVLLLLQLSVVCASSNEHEDADALESLAQRLRDMLKKDGKIEETKSSTKHENANVRANSMTQEMKDKVISLHNDYRKGEGASNMQKLVYNERLASLAQEWASRCNWGHRPHGSFEPSQYGQKTVGENIYAWSDPSIDVVLAAIKAWFEEKQYYDYNSKYCSKEPCGHYTQVVWADTLEVGCGVAECNPLNGAGFSGVYFVCNYGPGGNDGNHPFKVGQPCTECGTGSFFCTNGMCDASCPGGGGACECRANCNNGQQSGNCQCKCNQGYSGVSCNEVCADKNPMCGANPGWPQMFCHDKSAFGGMLYDQVNSNCLKMCGHCGSAKRYNNDEDELLEAIASALEHRYSASRNI